MSEDAIEELVRSIQEEWERTGQADAREAFEAFPHLTDHRQAMLDLIYAEYCTRFNQGKSVHSTEYCERFPSLAQSVMRMLSAHRFVQEHFDELIPPTENTWPQPGDRLGGVVLSRLLGKGGVARAYLGHHEEIGRPVVVKVTQGNHGEARTLGAIHHPHIVPIHDAVWIPDKGLSWITMPFLGTATLEDVLNVIRYERGVPRDVAKLQAAARAGGNPDDPPPLASTSHSPLYEGGIGGGSAPPARTGMEQIIHWGIEIAESLAYLHSQQIIHGDLKPTNVVIGPDCSSHLIDFNFARDQQLPQRRIGGTIPYMSPEQLTPLLDGAIAGEPKESSDIYSLGIILYELSRAHHPFPLPETSFPDQRNTRQRHRAMIDDLLRKRRAGAKLPRFQLRRNLARFSRILQDCLAYQAEDRPSAREVAERLRRIVRPRKHSRKLVPVLTSAIIVTSLAVSLGVWYPTNKEVTPQELLGEGYHALEKGAAQEAKKILSRAFVSEGLTEEERTECLFARARANIELREYEEAVWDLTRVAKKWPEDARVHALIAYSIRNGGDIRALWASQEARRLGMETPAVLNNHAYHLLADNERQGRMDMRVREAREILDGLIQNNPLAGTAARYNRAMLLYSEFLTKKAVDELSLAVADIEFVLAQVELPPLTLLYDAARVHAAFVTSAPVKAGESHFKDQSALRIRELYRQVKARGLSTQHFQTYPLFPPDLIPEEEPQGVMPRNQESLRLIKPHF